MGLWISTCTELLDVVYRSSRAIIGYLVDTAKGEVAMAVEYYHYVVEWQAVMCKECRHATWPAQVISHLTGRQDRIPTNDAARLADELQQ